MRALHLASSSAMLCMHSETALYISSCAGFAAPARLRKAEALCGRIHPSPTCQPDPAKILGKSGGNKDINSTIVMEII